MRTRAQQHTGSDLRDCMQRIQRGRQMQRALLMENDAGNPDLTRPLLDAVALFESLQIPYALVGGIAAMYYGRPRFTEDVDFIAATGHADSFAAHPGIRLWKDAHCDAMIARAVEVRLAGRQVRIVEPHDLIAMKLRSNRPRDDYDVSEIVKHQPIDDDVIQQRVDAEQYNHYLAVKSRISDA